MPVRVKGMIPEDDSRVAPIGHPAPPWMVNYADLMTELVCFFVILYALSAALNKDMQNAQQEIQQMIKKKQMAGQVDMNREGLRISLEEQNQQVFFGSGSADLTDQMRSEMGKLMPVLRKLAEKHDIVVEGHTDNIPITTRQFASNWELSTARATNVVKYMINNGFDPQRLAAVGYGEYHPIVPNDTPADRRKNRRVVFFVKNTAYPAAPGAAGAPKSQAPPAGAPQAAAQAPSAPSPESPVPAGEAPAPAGP